MKRNESYEFTIEDIEFKGNGIAFAEGLKIEIPGTYPGQKVFAKLTKKNQISGKAKLLKVLELPEDSIKSPCDSFNLGCGGCSYLDMEYHKELKLKDFQLKKLFPPSEFGEYEYLGTDKSPLEFHYRNKMEFSFGDYEKDGELTLGMHVKNRNYSIVNALSCKIVPDDFTIISEYTLNYFKSHNLKPYKIMSREGYLRNLVLRLGENSGELLVNLVTTSQVDFQLNEWLRGLSGLSLKNSLTGVLHTINDSLSDTVTGEVNLLHGRKFIYEELLGLKFKINPFSFFQTNSKGAEELYSIVRDFVGETENQVVFDLYCGTGTIGQIIAPKAKKVIGIELIEEAVSDAIANANLNNLTNTEFIAGDIAKVIHTLEEKPDTIILDPPRPGVHPFALDYVIKFNAPKIVYVSCNPKTLVTDMKKLQESGYILKKLKGKDMFPHTPHLEVVALLEKI